MDLEVSCNDLSSMMPNSLQSPFPPSLFLIYSPSRAGAALKRRLMKEIRHEEALWLLGVQTSPDMYVCVCIVWLVTRLEAAVAGDSCSPQSDWRHKTQATGTSDQQRPSVTHGLNHSVLPDLPITHRLPRAYTQTHVNA